MTKLSHKPVLTFRPYAEGDWKFDDPSMARAKLPPEIARRLDDPKEFVAFHGQIPVAVLDLFLDKKMKLIIAMKEGNYVFDPIILYQEALTFAESILSNADRILLDITVENLPVFKILEERGLLVLPKEAIYYPRNR
jgi:hypothetical protein